MTGREIHYAFFVRSSQKNDLKSGDLEFRMFPAAKVRNENMEVADEKDLDP